MSGQSIADEVNAALAEAQEELGPPQTCTLTKPGATGGPDYNKTTISDGTSYNISDKYVLSKFKSNQIDGELIRQGDVKILVGVFEVAPENDDYVDLSGSRYKVVNVESTSPAGVPVLHHLQLRQIGVSP